MAYLALYRKYRPETFSDVVGQAHIIDVLKNQIAGHKMAHAYLFSGPRGTGKTSTAKIFAKAINCLKPNGVEPCLTCASCESVYIDSGIDVVEIDAASNNGVENIRDLREKASLMPAIGKYKVYIIDEVHMLSQGAFNALLKTLEEPPSHVVFILATTEPKKLPATILSRCQKYDFKRHSVTDMMMRMRYVADDQKKQVTDEALVLIARAASGGMRDALSILDQCASGAGKLDANTVLTVLGGAGRAELFDLAKSITAYDEKNAILKLESIKDSGADIKVLLKDLAYLFKAMLFLQKGADALSAGVSDEEAVQLKNMGEAFGGTALIRALDILIENEVKMRMNSLPDIVLETAVIKLMNPQFDKKEAVTERLERLEGKLANLKTAPITHTSEPVKQQVVKQKSATTKAAPQAKPQTKVTPQVQLKGTVDTANVAEWSKVLNAIRDTDGYLYPYIKQMKMVEDAKNKFVFEIPEGVAHTFITDKANHSKVNDYMEKVFGKDVSFKVIPVARIKTQQKEMMYFADDMFDNQEIKEI